MNLTVKTTAAVAAALALALPASGIPTVLTARSLRKRVRQPAAIASTTWLLIDPTKPVVPIQEPPVTDIPAEDRA